MRVIKPEKWPRPSGYADGIAARGRSVFIAGQLGWDPLTRRFHSAQLAAQVEQALRNVVAVAKAAGAQSRHIVRMTWYITTRAEYLRTRKEIGKAYRQVMGKHFPAMSVLCVPALIETAAKVEIEATAVVPE